MKIGDKRIIAMLAVLLALTKANAQDFLEPDFRLFRYNQLVLNPAYAGFADRPTIGLSGQNFKFGNLARVQTLVAAADAPVRVLHGGLGIMATGMWQETQHYYFNTGEELSASLLYSYHIRFSEFVRLGIGAQIGFHKYHSKSGNDLESAGAYPEADGGLWLQGKRYSVGASVKNMLRKPYAYYYSDHQPQKFELHKYKTVTINGEYTFTISPQFQISPAGLIQVNTRKEPGFSEFYYLSLNNTFIVANKFHAGVAANFDGYLYGYDKDIIYQSYTINGGLDITERGQLMIGYTRSKENYFNLIDARLLLRF